MEEKRCTKCTVVKPLKAFDKRTDYSYRYQSQCRDCRRDTARKWRQKNVERARANYRKWREKNLEYAKEQRRNRYNADPEMAAINHAWWAIQNPEKVAAITRRRKARVRGASGDYKQEHWLVIKAFYGDKCLACGTNNDITVDHVVPIIVGGSNTIDNLQPLCARCNSKKGAQIIDYRVAQMELCI